MPVRPNVDAGRFVSSLIFLAIALLVVSLLSTGLLFGLITGAILGAGLFLMRRRFFHAGSPFAEHPDETLHLR